MSSTTLRNWIRNGLQAEPRTGRWAGRHTVRAVRSRRRIQPHENGEGIKCLGEFRDADAAWRPRGCSFSFFKRRSIQRLSPGRNQDEQGHVNKELQHRPHVMRVLPAATADACPRC